MKIFIVLILNFTFSALFAQEETLDDFYKISQENLKKYSLVELADLHPDQEFVIAQLFNQNHEEAKKILATLFSLKFRLVADQEILYRERQKKNEQKEQYQLSADLQEKYQWYKTKTGEELLLEECPQHSDYTLQEKGEIPYDFNGSKISSITETLDKFSGQTVLSFKFFEGTAKNFGDFTEKYLDRQLAIVFNQVVLSSPVIRSRIEGEGIITGLTPEEVKSLLSALQFENLEKLLDQGNPPDPKNFLFLKSITSLSLKQAQVLAQFQGRMIFLTGLTEIDDAVALVLHPIRLRIYATQKMMTQIRRY